MSTERPEERSERMDESEEELRTTRGGLPGLSDLPNEILEIILEELFDASEWCGKKRVTRRVEQPQTTQPLEDVCLVNKRLRQQLDAYMTRIDQDYRVREAVFKAKEHKDGDEYIFRFRNFGPPFPSAPCGACRNR
ncbi:hypothetical protein M3Y99_01590400 [Aphelenchoides fujianensis]|nr:hypothetical protein M3Y99_01590400 [Aphelenchoides fujianensis]